MNSSRGVVDLVGVGPAKGRCWHTRPQFGCALGTAEVQSSLEESQARLHADRRTHLPNPDAMPHLLKRQVSRETRRRGRTTCCPASALGTPRHMKPFNPAGQPSARSCGGTAERAVTRTADAGGASSSGSTVFASLAAGQHNAQVSAGAEPGPPRTAGWAGAFPAAATGETQNSGVRSDRPGQRLIDRAAAQGVLGERPLVSATLQPTRHDARQGNREIVPNHHRAPFTEQPGRLTPPGEVRLPPAIIAPGERYTGRRRAMSGGRLELIWEQEAAGSNPAIPTRFSNVLSVF